MGTVRKHLQFDEFISDAPTVFDEVATSDEEVVVERGGKLFSIRRKKARKLRGKRQFSPDDSLFGMIGIGASGKHDISTEKHKYLADAIADIQNDTEA